MKAEGKSPMGDGDELVDVALWMPFRSDLSETRERDAINPSRPSFDSNAFQGAQLCTMRLWLESVACLLWVCG